MSSSLVYGVTFVLYTFATPDLLHFADLLLSDVLVISTSRFLARTCFLAGQ